MLLFDPRRLGSAERLLRLAADRAQLRFIHGMSLLMGGMTEVGATPRTLVARHGKLEIWRYAAPAGAERARLGTPVLLVPPLMVRPYIFDLRPEHSMVDALRQAGLDVFLVDFGVPDDDDREVRLDHYVLEYLPTAAAEVRRAAGREALSLVGYCMGGIFSLLYTSAWADREIKNLVTIAAPIDMSKMGLLTTVARAAHRQAPALIDRIGNIPGQLTSQGLKMMAPIKRLTRYADLFVNLWNEEYVRGWEAMDRWTSEFIPYPREAFKQFVQELMVENKLVETLAFGDRVADLRTIDCAVLAFAGTGDTIATPASTRAICDLTAAAELDFREVPGGHIGVVSGSAAREQVWEPIRDWLVPRSA